MIIFKFKHIFFIIIMSLFIVPFVVLAEEIPQELYISPKGLLHTRGAEVTTKHALNYFTVSIWKFKLGVVTDYTTKFESAYGEPIKPSEIETGHILEIKGRPMPDKAGLAEASLIRDLSIKTGTPSSITSLSISDSFCPAASTIPAVVTPPFAGVVTPFIPPPTPPPSLSPAPAEQKISGESDGSQSFLTKNLDLGDRGKEVLILQEFLQKNNYGIPNDGPVTGYFGKVTQKAVINFQKANARPAVGKVGSQTRALINSLLVK